MPENKKRKAWVDSTIQGAIVRRIFLHWLCFFVVMLVCFAGMELVTGDPTKSVVDRLKDSSSGIIVVGIIMLVMLPAFILDAIRFSNRVVGPIFRLRKFVRNLLNNKQEAPLAFRGSDFWQEVAAEHNQLSELVAQQRNELNSRN